MARVPCFSHHHADQQRHLNPVWLTVAAALHTSMLSQALRSLNPDSTRFAAGAGDNGRSKGAEVGCTHGLDLHLLSVWFPKRRYQ
jgi:hypothetical protein